MVVVIFSKTCIKLCIKFQPFFMKQDKVLVKIVPDIRRIKTGSKFPLKLRVTHKGERKYYATGLDVSDEQWETINSAEAKGKFQKMRIEMAEIERKALECISEIVSFSFVTFEREFFREVAAEQTVELAYESYISELRANEQFGTAKSYQDSNNTLKRFRPGKLRFEDVTKEFLNDNGYLFDILDVSDQGEPARLKVELFTHFVNEWMKGLGKKLGFHLSLTTYVARHSFATILVRSGAPLALAK